VVRLDNRRQNPDVRLGNQPPRRQISGQQGSLPSAVGRALPIYSERGLQGDRIAWYRPARRTSLHFQARDFPFKNLIPCREVRVLVCSYLVQVQAEIFGMSIGGLKIGQLAEAAEVNFETVRYYERIGLMPRPIRTKGGHRHYGHEHLRRLTFIRRARELGFHIEEIRSLLVLNKSGNGSCADVKAIAANHLADVREKISALAKMERTLAILIEGCSEERSLCPILDMLDSERDISAPGRAHPTS
jgi:MerR family transcriptional regulator, mercuric resistance operon regulatory protein